MATERYYTANESEHRLYQSSPSGRGYKFYAVKAGRETGIFTSW